MPLLSWLPSSTGSSIWKLTLANVWQTDHFFFFFFMANVWQIMANV